MYRVSILYNRLYREYAILWCYPNVQWELYIIVDLEYPIVKSSAQLMVSDQAIYTIIYIVLDLKEIKVTADRDCLVFNDAQCRTGLAQKCRYVFICIDLVFIVPRESIIVFYTGFSREWVE